jgi:hypothetical protein
LEQIHPTNQPEREMQARKASTAETNQAAWTDLGLLLAKMGGP